jgi:thioredoxin-related protein
MRHSLIIVLLLSLVSVAWDASTDKLDEGLVNPGYVEKPEWFKNSFLDLREDLDEATAEGKRLLFYFYQDGCPYCEKLINTNFAQRDIVKKARSNFDVIAINMWGDRMVLDQQGEELSEKAFAVRHRIQFTPTLLFLDENGDEVLRINGYYPPHRFLAALEYASGKQAKRLPFREWLAQQQPVAASGKLHREKRFLPYPYDLQKRSGNKPLLVLFEQKECAPCDELHGEALRRLETQPLLKQLDVAVLDIWSKEKVTTPAGVPLGQKAWAKQLGIQYAPSLVFFDAQGREVFRTEAYLRPFHFQSAMEYVISGAYKTQPEFQRYVQDRADHLREQGVEVDIWR